uniref:NADH-ubiquinone oxidoreductase chain 2 n=1 Tax=Atta opaciceps TaxID=592322 RepID=A0A249RWS3_9HYME|nr:NADH dehydrogenase subunit 2 [Atta opaciceps]
MFLFIFSFMPLFINDLMIIWFFLEITNFLFIFLLNLFMNNKKIIFMYFLIQIISSFFMIFSISINNLILSNNYIYYILFTSLLIKLSIPPFHFWFPLISKFLPYNMLLTLTTIQKIIPFYIMSLIKLNNFFIIYFILILCSIIPPFLSLNITNFKMIIAYSSINQSSWMILMIYMKTLSWLMYFIFYSFSLMSLIFIISLFKMFKNSMTMMSNNINLNLLFLFILFNVSGMPPFSMFFMKWYSIFLFMKLNNLIMIMIIMMFSSLFMLFIYNNMLFHALFLFKFESKLIKLNYYYNNISMFILLPLSLSLIILMI